MLMVPADQKLKKRLRRLEGLQGLGSRGERLFEVRIHDLPEYGLFAHTFLRWAATKVFLIGSIGTRSKSWSGSCKALARRLRTCLQRQIPPTTLPHPISRQQFQTQDMHRSPRMESRRLEVHPRADQNPRTHFARGRQARRWPR